MAWAAVGGGEGVEARQRDGSDSGYANSGVGHIGGRRRLGSGDSNGSRRGNECGQRQLP